MLCPYSFSAKPNVPFLVQVFSDRDILSQRHKVEAALKGADVFFGSLIFDYDQAGLADETIGGTFLHRFLCHHSKCLIRPRLNG